MYGIVEIRCLDSLLCVIQRCECRFDVLQCGIDWINLEISSFLRRITSFFCLAFWNTGFGENNGFTSALIYLIYSIRFDGIRSMAVVVLLFEFNEYDRWIDGIWFRYSISQNPRCCLSKFLILLPSNFWFCFQVPILTVLEIWI